MRIIWSARARREAYGFAEDYREIDGDLADRMLHRIITAPEPLKSYPHRGSPGLDGSRKWRVSGTPYLIFYDVTDAGVEIVTVQHDRSDWRRTR